ncbi:hypothetical protein [Salinisphaera sp. G21_0]|uniref:hypothetical protein n=1 Tax=Salinisphaera sp. G21_0 TaxID=2821094 RepID=UPI001ADC9FDB|nr:hypothetical protein [Salinisphaera sp. G21_0]MBO9483139.1 hypothetical protein [Salinisphaera sp. G21_0]
MRRIAEMLNSDGKAQVAELVDALASGADVPLTGCRLVLEEIYFQNNGLGFFLSYMTFVVS